MLEGHARGVAWLAAAAASLPAALLAAELRIEKGKDVVTVKRGDKPVVEYRCAPNPFKPYVSKLYTPDEIHSIRDGERAP